MAEYSLTGPQVEPEASYWLYCPHPWVIVIDDLRRLTDDAGSEDYFPPYPGESETEREYKELVDLSGKRDDPCALVNDKCKDLPDTCKQDKKLPGKFGCRRPISKLLNLSPPALGAVVMNRLPGEQIIRTGRGMARAVESETPGLFHRHALNYLIRLRNWSPPRQALVWAALDVAIASALNAAWYYKWLAAGRAPGTARRERPIEWAKRNGKPLDVLFDRPDELNPAYNLCPDGRPKGGTWPNNASGTPRHPAYPSGHSTYAGAASEILAFFFGAQATPQELPSDPRLGSVSGTSLKQELDYLSDNIGMGRLWAGIHWRSDHEAGVKLGRTVAQMVLQQIADIGSVNCKDGKAGKVRGFNACGTPPPDINQCNFNEGKCDETTKAPSREELECEAKAIEAACGKQKEFECPCPAPKTTSTASAIDYGRGTQSN